MVVHSGDARLNVSVHADGVFRVRLAPDGRFDGDASWAVVQAADPPRVTITEDRDAVRVESGGITAIVHRSPLRVEFADRDARTLLADEAGLPMAWMPTAHGTRVRAWKSMPGDEHYYGLGDKAGPLDRRGRAFAMWNVDAYAWQGHSDPLYKSIPFFIGLRDGVAFGVFVDNTHRSRFDVGKESDDFFSFGADGGALDYYLIDGPQPAKVMRALHRADRAHAAAAAVVARLPAVALQLQPRSEGARDREAAARAPHSQRRDLARHRLPARLTRRSPSIARSSRISRT